MNRLASVRVAALASGLLLFFSSNALGHCDGLDGPVVKAAQAALAAGRVELALIWVQPNDEAEIRKVFRRTLAVRKLGADARELADLHFFETLVRLHRAGEGAPYTGLKPAGRDPGAAIRAADAAVATGSAEPLAKLLLESVEHGLHEQFARVRKTAGFAPDDVRAGREHVKAYVEFVHYVERLHAAAATPAHGHAEESTDPHR